MRIASLLPSATEIVCALGLREHLVGISHSCDYPAGLEGLPVLTRTAVPVTASSREIDQFVRRYLGGANSLYQLDLARLEAIQPDLVVSQRLCDVCAVSMNEVEDALCALPSQPALVDTEPSSLSDVYGDIRRVAAAAGIGERGERLVSDLQARVSAVAAITARVPQGNKPRLAVIEWLDPPFNSGHWTPELVELAGAVDVLGPRGQPSHTLRWPDVLAARPDVVLLSVCGFSRQRTMSEVASLDHDPDWQAVRALVGGRVHLIDGNAYLTRPGPRLVDALEALAHALHPANHPDPGNGVVIETLA